MSSVTVAVLAGGVLNMFFFVFLPPQIKDLFGAPITSGIYAREPLSLKKSHFKIVNGEGGFVWMCGRVDFPEKFLSSC